jgi:hypothetical protein
MSQTKSALHRTRLPLLNLELFSVFFSYKPDRQTAPLLGLWSKIQIEKIEKNFSIFQQKKSLVD